MSRFILSLGTWNSHIWQSVSFRRPVDEHIVVKEGEQYAAVFNDTRMIGEEVNITYTVTSADRDHSWRLVDINTHIYRYVLQYITKDTHLPLIYVTRLCHSSYQVEKAGDLVTPPLDLKVTYPELSARDNYLLYLTHVISSPGVSVNTLVGHSCWHNSTDPPSHLPLLSVQVKCEAEGLINPLNLNPDSIKPNPKKESLSIYLMVGDEIVWALFPADLSCLTVSVFDFSTEVWNVQL